MRKKFECNRCGGSYDAHPGCVHWCGKPSKFEPLFPQANSDKVNHPEHYTAGDIECIDAIAAALTPEEFRGYLKGNVFKYTWRERHKGGEESMRKARWYINRLLGDA